MTHEAARRSVSRLWLRAFAGIVAALSASSAKGGSLELEPVLPGAPFAATSSTDERMPVRAFATAAGVYELDVKTKSVRVWPRKESRVSNELVSSRFAGVDSAGSGSKFGSPVSMAKQPGKNVIAVLDACPSLPNMAAAPKPRIAFYSFAETQTGGVLSSVSFTKIGEIVAPALANGTDVSFFASGDKVAVSFSKYSSSATDGDSGAVRLYDGFDAEDPTASFLVVRCKNVYEGSANMNSVGSERYDVPATGVCMDPDGKRVYVGSANLNAVLRYDPVSGTTYDEEIIVRTWEYNWTEGYRWVVETFSAATADFVQGAGDGGEIFEVPTGFDPGNIGLGGSTNNLLSAPGSVMVWKSPNGNLLVVADRDNDRVAAFDEKGNGRFSFDASYREDTAFHMPQGVWISDDGSEMVVADTGHGRVEIFRLSEDDSKPDENFSVVLDSGVFVESDAQVFTNWIVAAAPGLSDRTYSVSVSADPAGGASVEPASVTIPAGADRVPFVLRPLDGVADGTACTVSVAGPASTETASFVVVNAAPTVRTGPRTEEDLDDQSYLYADEGLINDPLEYMWGMFAPESFRPIILAEGESLHLHAKAFDVAADAGLTYEWRIVGTKYFLPLGGLVESSLAECEPDSIFDWTPYYYYEYTNGVPPSVLRKTFSVEEAEAMPKDGAGNPLCIEVHTNQQVSAEFWTTTNVLHYAESTNWVDPDGFGYDKKQMINWAPILFDDARNGKFLVSDTMLTGADATFSGAEPGVLYFASLKVTDKDGGTWDLVDDHHGSFFAFATGSGVEPPPPSTAVYAARFTAVEGDADSFAVTFTVTLFSGDPSASDTVSIEAAPSLSGPWTKLGGSKQVGDKFVSDRSAQVQIRVPNVQSGDIRFYRVVQP
jgi:hypothetical protein